MKACWILHKQLFPNVGHAALSVLVEEYCDDWEAQKSQVQLGVLYACLFKEDNIQAGAE